MIRKIIIISLDNLGDTVFASSVVSPLKQAFPEAEIHLFSKEYSSGIAPLISGLTGSFSADPFWDTSPYRSNGGMIPFLSALKKAHHQNFDLALSLSHAWREYLCAKLCARSVLALQEKPNPERPVLELLSQMLKSLGMNVTLRCELNETPLLERKNRIRSHIGNFSPIAALHPFAGDRRRCVNIKEWKEVAEKIKERGFFALWIGVNAELEQLRLEVGQSPTHAFIDQIGDGSVQDLAAALSLASFFIGHDSGPLHLANALGTPVLGIYTPGQPQRTFPQGRGIWEMLTRPSPQNVRASDIISVLEKLLRHQILDAKGSNEA